MRTVLFTILIMGVGIASLFAQGEIKINEVEFTNLGDGRYYCQEIKTKKPVEGKTRIIDGVTTQYIEAVFKKGFPDGIWKLYKYNVLAEECTYKEGILHGDRIEYYSDASKKSVQHFVNGKAEGKFVNYYTNGKVESETNFKNGLQDGTEIHYDIEGNVRSSVTYIAGKETGVKKLTLSDYELTANYKNGVYDGDYSEIYSNGNVKITGHYINGKKDGTWEFGKREGGKIRTEVYANDDKIKETVYFTDGSVEVTRELKNGKKNGWERTYNFREGTLKSELFYVDGQVSSNTAGGSATGSSSSGLAKQTKQMTGSYGVYIQTFYQNNGKYEGEFTEQWAEGDKGVKTKGQYENGKKTGLWVYFDKYGQKEKEETFANDKLEGKQTMYDGSNISKIFNFKNDVKNGEFAIYQEGRLREKGTYVDDRIEGVHIQYYANGKPSSEYTIPHNPNGERIEKDYAQTGNIRAERRYENGRQVGEKQYFDNGKLRRVLQRNADGRLETVEEYDESGKKIN